MNVPGNRTSLASDPRIRIIAYALVLTVVAGFCSFHRLSEGTLFGDEAAFAFTTERMRDTGDWVVPYIGDQPHFNAAPLYNWLTLAIAPAFDGTPLWHRLWSAVFGVGCVLVAFALGTLLFRAEVGLLGGLFLAFNRDFLFCHCVRMGAMDSMTAFFIGAAVCCYAWIRTRPLRAETPAWCLLGLSIGLAWMSKPPVFGCFFLAVICLHHLWVRRSEPIASRVAGPFLAVAAGLVVAAPWYVLMWSRLGNACLHALFVYNSVERALDSTNRDPLCCHNSIVHASLGFKFVEAAMACALGCWIVKDRRPQWGLLLTLAGSFLLALSAAGKALNYIYYAFPLLAVLLAGLFLESGPRLATWIRSGRSRFASLAFAVLGVALVAADGIKTVRTALESAWVHPPMGIYERLAPKSLEGDADSFGSTPIRRAAPLRRSRTTRLSRTSTTRIACRWRSESATSRN